MKNAILNLYFLLHKYMKFKLYNISKNIFNCRVLQREESEENGDLIPKIIWMYWHDNNIPVSVSICHENIKKNNPSFVVNFLNSENLSNYLDIKFYDDVNILPAHRSDLIRLCLLEKYGGIWIDATTIISESLEWVIQKSINHNYDFIGFYHHRSTLDFSYPVIDNWFMAVPLNSQFIKKWKEELYPIIELGSSGMFESIQSSVDFVDIKQKIENVEYMISYLLHQRVLRSTNLSYFLICSEDEAFFIQEKNNWKSYKTAVDICFKKNNININYIKLTSLDRFYVEKIFKDYGCNCDSVLGRLNDECFKKNKK